RYPAPHRQVGSADVMVAGLRPAPRWRDAAPNGRSRIIRRPLFRADGAPRHHRQGSSIMAALRLAIAALALAAAAPARTDPVAAWRPYVAEASARFGVPIAWIEQ